MDYAINELEQETLNATREFAQKKLKPVRAEMDEKEVFSEKTLQEFRKSGMFGVWLPQKYGGVGGGITCLAMAFEEFSRVCAGLALTPGTTALGAIPMFLAATEEQRERWCYVHLSICFQHIVLLFVTLVLSLTIIFPSPHNLQPHPELFSLPAPLTNYYPKQLLRELTFQNTPLRNTTLPL